MTSRRILVIDDEKPTLEMFELFLKVYGYDVLLAANGTEGIQLFETHNPAIVFTDIKMPGMDGLAVLDVIKAKSPEAEVIIMTGHGDMDLAVEALNHEATDFINKPISRSALDSALHRAEERLKAAKTDTPVAQYCQENGIQVINILGNIDAGAEDTLKAQYKQAGTQDKVSILINFNENTSINGAGIAVLIQLLSEANKRHQKVAMAGISENFQEIFKMVGIHRFSGIFSYQSDAIAFLKHHD